jgi:hypothetical protein|tara:strand:+ start:232 stop:1005 length:774 start_codon:yes stop_codon:yes gene_type:complete
MKTRCQYCNQKLEIPEELIGSKIECPACNKDIEIRESLTSNDENDLSKTDLKNDQKISLGSTKSHKGKDFKKTSNPTRHKIINNPTGRLIKNDLSDGFLNDFIPENMMIWISVLLLIISSLLSYLQMGVPGLFLSFISTLVFVFLNTVFFIRITNWLCGRYVNQYAAFSTIIFTAAISSIPNELINLAGIQTGSFLYVIFILLIQSVIFDLRLKEGLGKSFGIAFFIFLLNIAIAFCLGCILSAVAIGIYAPRIMGG